MVSSTRTVTRAAVARVVGFRFLIGIIMLSAVILIPRGSLAYWQAWGFFAVLYIPLLYTMVYYLKNDPGFLERRMRLHEQRRQQRLIVRLAWIPFLLSFILPGLDVRFGWSNVPMAVCIIALALSLMGYLFVLWVFHTNRFAGRTVQVDEGQTVISSGPYAIVRHPMYLGTILLYTFAPLGLGSYWAVIPAMVIAPILIARIIDEEKVLVNELKGYAEYRHKTRFRLIPGVW